MCIKQILKTKKTALQIQNGFLFLKSNYFFEQQDFLAAVAFLSEQQAFSVFALAFGFSFSLKDTTAAEETINAITAAIDNTFFMIFILSYINFNSIFKYIKF